MSDAVDIVDKPGVPTVKEAAAAAVQRAPRSLRRLLLNAFAVIGWIGLPSTILSTLSGLQWVLDGAAWLYHNAGVLQPALDAAGQGIVAFVALWRSLVHPVWSALSDLFGIALPPWASDILTLAALIAIGVTRRTLKAMWDGHLVSGGLMMRGADRSRAPEADYVRMPRRFPYAQHFADNGVRMTRTRLRDAQRLWRKWRAEQIRMFLIRDGSRWPLVRDEVTRAQFGRFWLAIMDGRRALTIYLLAATLVVAAYLLDWSYRVAAVC